MPLEPKLQELHKRRLAEREKQKETIWATRQRLRNKSVFFLVLPQKRPEQENQVSDTTDVTLDEKTSGCSIDGQGHRNVFQIIKLKINDLSSINWMAFICPIECTKHCLSVIDWNRWIKKIHNNINIIVSNSNSI